MIRIYPSRLPGEPLETHQVERGMTVAAWLAANVKGFDLERQQPITLDVDGVTIAPAAWTETIIGPGSDVRIYPVPHDAAWGFLVDPITTITYYAGKAVYDMFQMPDFKAPGAGKTLGQETANANLARPNGVVRELLGQERIYPDLIAQQVTRFVGKRRMETQMLLCIGTGRYSILGGGIRVGNTPFASMGTDAAYEIYEPGESLAGDRAAENWYLAPEVGATGAGTTGLDLGSEETAGESPSTDALFLSGKSITLVGAEAEFPSPWTSGAIVIVSTPDSYDVALVGGRSRISGNLSDLGPSVGMPVTLTIGGDSYELLVSSHAPAVPAVPGTGGSPSFVSASAAPSTYNFASVPAVWTITYQGVTRTLSCAADYANMSQLVADITAQLSGMGLTAQDDSGRLKIGEPLSPYRGGVISQSSAPIELFGVAPTYTTGVASTGGSPGQAAYVELNYDDAEGGEPATPFSGLPAGPQRLAISHRGSRYKLASVGVKTAALDRVSEAGAVIAWAGWAPRTLLDFTAYAAPTGENWIGPYFACPDNEKTSALEYDVFFPSGLAVVDDKGRVLKITRGVDLEWRDGDIGGPWTRVSTSYREWTLDQIGFTHSVSLPYPMRPQVRARRTGASGNSRASEKIHWMGLRAKLPNATSYPGVTTMTIKMRTGSRLSAQSDRKISLVANRLYPDGLSRSIRDAILCITDSLGISRSPLDMEQIDALQAAYWSPRGETFDLDVTDQSAVRDMLRQILAAGMSHLKLSDGLISATREGVQSVPVGSLSPQEMTGELTVSFTSPSDDDYDGVDVTYLDQVTRTKETIQCRMPGSLGRQVENMDVPGVVDRTRAWRIGMRRLRKHLGQRMTFSCDTEMDGLNFEFNDRVLLTDDLPGTTMSALIVGAEHVDGRVIVELTEDLDWSVSAPRCVIRRHDGTATPVLLPEQVASNRLSLPAAAIDFELLTDDPWIEPARLMFGPSTRLGYDVLIEEIAPGSDGSCSISAVQYSADYYADDNNAPA